MGLNFLHRFLPVFFRKTPTGPETVGELGERLAAEHLMRQGMQILARNERNPAGEIDIIAVSTCKRRRSIVFIEVKTWSHSENGSGPSDAVDDRKQRQITNAALFYLRRNRLLNHPVRFDVIAVTLDQSDGKPHLRHFENAFEACGSFQMFQ